MEAIMAMLETRPIQIQGALVTVIPIGDTVAEALQSVAMLRSCGIRANTDTSGRKLKKSLAAASSKGTRYVMLIGEQEASQGKVKLKDMSEMTETELSLQEAISIIKYSSDYPID